MQHGDVQLLARSRRPVRVKRVLDRVRVRHDDDLAHVPGGHRGAQRGQWVVVNFFSTTCIPCIQEHPELVKFSEQRDDVSIVSVTFEDRPAAVKDFFEQHGGDWPVLLENTGSIAISYGVTAVPESYLIDPFGIVRVKIIGGVTADKLSGYIDGLSS